MASPGLNEDADAERNRANLVSFVLRPLSSRATISRYLLEDAGSLSLASKVVYELMVSRLPAVSPNISEMPVERLYIACRPINALTASSWPGLARLNEILAKLPGVGAPVKLGSTEIAPANSVFGFESLTLTISFSSPPPRSQLFLGDLASSSLQNISKLVLHGNVACGDVATLLPLLARLRNLAIVHCQGVSGTFTGPVVRFISDIRKKHGHDAVSLKGCGRFDLADDLSDIADIAHIDLSSIDTLLGGCGHLFPSSLIRPRVCLHRYPRTLFRQLSLGQSPHKSFREKSYVTLLFEELPSDFTQLLFFVQVTSLFSSTRP